MILVEKSFFFTIENILRTEYLQIYSGQCDL